MSNYQKRINLNHLPVFVSIVEAGSITAAARRLGSDKTRVSRILAELETDLGIQLALRTTRHLQLTEEGRALYQRCKSALEDLEEAAGQVVDRGEEVRGHIRITGAHGIISFVLPEIVQKFLQRHPKVTFDVVLAQEKLDLVKDGIDLALRIGPLEDSSYKARKLGECKFLFVATPGFLGAGSRLSAIEDLSSCPIIAFPHYSGTSFSVSARGKSKKLRLESGIVCNSPDLILGMTLKGIGVGILPELICREYLRTGQLVQLFEPWGPTPAPISMVFHPSGRTRPHLSLFMNFLASSVEYQLRGPRP
jgi:LysR family transcriptional regulator for bpeEF and oprC